VDKLKGIRDSTKTNNERAAQAAKIINEAVERSKLDQD
jgi:hypothetical protein